MTSTPLTPKREPSGMGQALLIAVAIEALGFAGLIGWLNRPVVHIPKPVPVAVTLAAAPPAPLAPPAPPTPAQPRTPPVAPKVVPPRLVKTAPPTQKTVHPTTQKAVVPNDHQPDLPRTDQPGDQAAQQASADATQAAQPHKNAAAQESAAPAPAAAAQSNATPTLLFQAALRDAVQAAVRYPPAARMMHISGQARVGFHYLDGVMSQPRIVRSSGNAMLDEAALSALASASFPAPPKDLRGHPLILEVVVNFTPPDD